MMFEEKICVGPINPHSEGQFYGSLAWGQIHMSAKVDSHKHGCVATTRPFIQLLCTLVILVIFAV